MPRPKKTPTVENIDLSGAPNKRYETFFKKFGEIDSLPVQKWRGVHLIGHFSRLYEKKFGVKYSFKFDRAPSSCYEAFQMKRLAGALTPDPTTLKDFIDWVFENKVTDKTNFRVMGFMVNEKFIYEFKMGRKRSQQITRTTVLPPSILQILEDLEIQSVNTYGDLAFLKQAMEGGDDDYDKVFVQLDAVGFDRSLLETVR